jgi:hypothetical protein
MLSFMFGRRPGTAASLGMAPEDADRYDEMGRFAGKHWARAGAPAKP